MIDFKALRESLNIAEVAHTILKLTPENGQYRAPCPGCNAGGDRAIVITPAKKLFYCFNAKKGGDAIGLVAHVKNIGMKEAAMSLMPKEEPKEEPPKEKEQGFDVEKYRAGLKTDHELLTQSGIFKDVAEALQIGVATAGAHANRIAFPLYDKNGKFLAYASATQVKLPKHWKRA